MKNVRFVKRSQIEVEERQALLQRRHGAPGLNAVMSNAAQDDAHLKANSSLQRSHDMLDQYLSQGSNVLSSLSTQREALKNARRLILDIGTRLGVSQSILAAVTRRESGDKWIVFGGMVITLGVIYFVFSFVF